MDGTQASLTVFSSTSTASLAAPSLVASVRNPPQNFQPAPATRTEDDVDELDELEEDEPGFGALSTSEHGPRVEGGQAGEAAALTSGMGTAQTTPVKFAASSSAYSNCSPTPGNAGHSPHESTRARWTLEEDATLRRYKQEGKTMAEIARLMERTESALAGRWYSQRKRWVVQGLLPAPPTELSPAATSSSAPLPSVCTSSFKVLSADQLWRTWTAEEEAVIRNLRFEQRRSYEHVAAALGRTVIAVKSRAMIMRKRARTSGAGAGAPSPSSSTAPTSTPIPPSSRPSSPPPANLSAHASIAHLPSIVPALSRSADLFPTSSHPPPFRTSTANLSDPPTQPATSPPLQAAVDGATSASPPLKAPPAPASSPAPTSDACLPTLFFPPVPSDARLAFLSSALPSPRPSPPPSTANPSPTRRRSSSTGFEAELQRAKRQRVAHVIESAVAEARGADAEGGIDEGAAELEIEEVSPVAGDEDEDIKPHLFTAPLHSPIPRFSPPPGRRGVRSDPFAGWALARKATRAFVRGAREDEAGAA